MIELQSTLKVQTKNISLRLTEQTNDISDILYQKINEIAKDNFTDFSISKPVMLRELIDQGIMNNLVILKIFDREYSIKDILTYKDNNSISEFQGNEIKDITSIFHKNGLKDFLITITHNVCSTTIENIKELSLDDELDEDDIEEFEKELDEITDIFDGSFDENDEDDILSTYSQLHYLMESYPLTIEELEECFIQEFKECYEYKKILMLYYFEPSICNICMNQTNILVNEWLKFCELYGWESKGGKISRITTTDEFIEEIEFKIGKKFQDSELI